jgi:CheY-like chemotaxis protein
MKNTILLVEDSKIQKLAAETILLRAGYLLLFADSGEEALRLAGESVPDLVLLDLHLPGISGEEVLHALKRDPRTSRIPVIIFSQVPATQSLQLKQAGAADYFEKARLNAEGGEAAFIRTIDRLLSDSKQSKEPRKLASVARRNL